MKLTALIKNVKVIDPTSKYHQQKVDILVEKGKITQIGKAIKTHVKNILNYNNAFVSGVWFDALANFNEPGNEHKEDFESGIKAAMMGGFGNVGISPNTLPIVDNKTMVNFVQSKNGHSNIKLHPIASATLQLKGEILSEIHDMSAAGAVGFVHTNKHSSLGNLSRSMQYVNDSQKVFISVPYDDSFVPQASVNESPSTLKLGLKGTPNLAEFVNVERDIRLAEYHESRIHFSLITCKESVELIKKAKKKGLKVTASVSIAHLLYSDEDLETYDSNYKVYPPLRSKNDLASLKKGVLDGTIDIIVSNHEPQDNESKNVEFGYAEFGISCIHTMLPMIKMAFEDNYLSVIPAISLKPYQIFGIDIPKIAKNEKANLTIWTENKWQFTSENNPSKSNNNPLLGSELNGKIEFVEVN